MMSAVELTAEELDLLRELLEADLSELRMEIVDTDNSQFKDGLKHRKRVMMDILEKLPKSESGE